MGLRFRRSITLCKGVKLNFGKTGASITTGVKGFHKTYNFNTGKVTTSVGIPGTGIYYTDTSGGNKKTEKQSSVANSTFVTATQTENTGDSTVHSQSYPTEPHVVPSVPYETEQGIFESNKTITDEKIETIYRVCDEKIDWFEILSSTKPTNQWIPDNIWTYLHNVAVKVCSTDHDSVLDVIETINPFNDLLDYCKNFECGFEDDDVLQIGFEINDRLIFDGIESKEEFTKACIIRIARDTFALLPIDKIIISLFDHDNTLVSKTFFADTFRKINFRFASIDDIFEKS